MDAVQVMRQKAEDAGNLKSTPQQTVTTQDSTISIQPANPDTVYIPAYDPWLVYGRPNRGRGRDGTRILESGLAARTSRSDSASESASTADTDGLGHWGFDWHNHYAIYNHGRYYSPSRTFYNRNAYSRGGSARGVNSARGGVNARNAGNRPTSGSMGARAEPPTAPVHRQGHSREHQGSPRICCT